MFLIRKIRKPRWESPKYAINLLEENDFWSDPLGDLSTQKSRLSLFFVEENAESINRVVCALVTGTQSLSNFDYVIFSKEIIDQLKIKTEQNPGNTIDQYVNDQHIDLVELSGHQLTSLAKLIQEKGKIKRILPKDVTKAILLSLDKGYIERSHMSPKFCQSFEKWEKKLN